MNSNKEALIEELNGYLAELEQIEEVYRNNNDSDGDYPLTITEQTVLSNLQNLIDISKTDIRKINSNYIETTQTSIHLNLRAPLGADVGTDAPNHPQDVQLVIGWLNNWGYRINPDADISTVISTIKTFQKEQLDVDERECIISVGGMTWRLLSNNPIDTSTLGQAETEEEKIMLQFQDEFEHLKVRLNPGEKSEVFADVQMPYVNRGRKEKPNPKYVKALEERKKNRPVNKLIHECNLKDARATPNRIIEFLEESIKKGLISVDPGNPKKSSEILRKYLMKYAIGADCFGVVGQAKNYQEQGQKHEYGHYEDDKFKIGGSQGLLGEYDPDYYKEIDIKDLQADDVMFLPKEGNSHRHARVVVDVDVTAEYFMFMTIESSSGGKGNGANSVMWRYDYLDNFAILWKSTDKGESWEKDISVVQYIRRK